VPDPAEWFIEPLSDRHIRDDFDCGVEGLDSFIRQLASQYQRRNLGRTWVAVTRESLHILGYYTLSNGAIEPSLMPTASRKKLPKTLPIPIMHLGRLAVDHRSSSRGLGEHLLLDALRRTWEQSRQVGIHAVEVRAINEDAQSFYEHFGFVPLMDDALHLYLPITTIQKLFSKDE